MDPGKDADIVVVSTEKADIVVRMCALHITNAESLNLHFGDTIGG